MASLPKLSTVVSWIIYLIPIYIFVFAPLLRQFFPESPEAELDDVDYDIDTDLPSHLKDDSFISPEDGVPFHCPAGSNDYKIHILALEPLVIYIEDFLKDWEADHLVDVSVGNYTPSIVYDGVTQKVDPNKRLSDRALLSRDNIVRCIEDRARAFQGWRPHLYIERMWAQRYNASGHYGYHYDWAGTAGRGGDRISTFMVYLGDECKGGGTNFPRLRMPQGEKWCRFLECEGEDEGAHEEGGGSEGGVTFKPIKGNAIFWVNLRPDGTGYTETWHKAFPVKEGVKVGLNIWSWYQPPEWNRRRGRGGR